MWAKFKVQSKQKFGRIPSDTEEIEGLDPRDFFGSRLERLVRQAFEQEEISIGRAAEILRIPLMEMRSYVRDWESK